MTGDCAMETEEDLFGMDTYKLGRNGDLPCAR